MILGYGDENRQRTDIVRVLDVCETAALKAGGQGTRYTCRVEGKEIYLFCDRGFWFIEV